MGSFLAAFRGQFRWEVFTLSALTTVFLQVLSNLANDYGDSIHGADSEVRKGPQRAVQSGQITAVVMKRAMIFCAVLALLTGVGLLYISLGEDTRLFVLFLVLGLVAIAAAVTYTAGARPYGYAGLGDLSVLIFFGIVGVLGSYYLHAPGNLTGDMVLPALSCGFFSVAVLNVNNIRDIESDKAAGKRSIPVRIGRKSAVGYHWFLLSFGWLAAVGYTLFNYQSIFQFLYLLTLPLFLKNASAVYRYQSESELDPYLKQMAISTLFFVILFGVGLLLSK